MKPSVLYWAMSAAFLGGLVFRANVARAILGGELTLPDAVWRRVSLVWGIFFLALGGVNLWIAFNFSLEAWVNFKTFGAMGLIMVLAIAQAFWLAQYIEDEPADAKGPES